MPARARATSGGPRGSEEGDALWDELRDCHRQLRAELRSVVLRRGLYLSEYRALGRLEEHPRSLTELSQLLGMTPASMTDLARQLRRRGWVTRRPDPADRRAQRLSITARGRRARRAARTEYRERLHEVYGGLSGEARSALALGLRELGGLLAARARSAEPAAP